MRNIDRRCKQVSNLLGIGHLAGRALDSLSGGEKQRVAVASIIAADPDIIVLDEPTASLDPEASEDLFRKLAGLCRNAGLAVIIIEHKLAQLLPFHPRLIRMEAGRIVEDQQQACRAGGLLPSVDRAPQIAAARCDRAAGPAATIAEATGLTMEMDGKVILRDVSFSLDAGQCTALIGPNGGGKTTLLHALAGLAPPAGGSIHVGDVRVAPSTASRLARNVGLVFQNADHQVVADTIRDEALFTARRLGLLDADLESEALALLDRAGLSGRLDDHPFSLSWGEKRRLNLISAVLHRPRLLLLDEPFAGQDHDNVAFLLDVIRNLIHGTDAACLLVIHDAHTAARACDRVIFLDEGRVVVDAPTTVAFARLYALGRNAYTPQPGRSLSEDVPTGEEGGQVVPGSSLRFQPVAATSVANRSPHAVHPRLAYQSGQSLLHRLHPATKVAWLLWITVAVFLVDSPALVIASAGVLITMLWLADVPPHRIPHVRLWLSLCVGVLLLQIIFTRDGAPLFACATDVGIETGVRTAGRLLAIVLASTLFVTTTDPVALAAGLMSVGLPYRWGFTLVTTLRLAPTFRIEAHHVYRAQSIRGVAYDAIGPRRWWFLLRNLCVLLIVGALRTAHTLSLSMEGRAFGLHPLRTFCRRVVLACADWVAIVLLFATIIAAILPA